MAAFFSGLVGSYAGAMRDKQRQERDIEDKKIDSQIAMVQAAASAGYADWSEAASRVDELLQQKGKKGKFSLKNLVGDFQYKGGAQQASAGGAKSPQPGTPSATSPTQQQSQPQTGAPPQASLSPLPSPFKFRTQEEVEQRRIKQITDEEKAVAKARFKEADEEEKKRILDAKDEYMKSHPGASPADVYDAVTAPMLGIQPKPKPITKLVDDPKSTTGKSWVTYDELTGKEYSRQPAPKEKPAPKSAHDKAVEGRAADILADAQAKGQSMTEQQAETKARQMFLEEAREHLYRTIEARKGAQMGRKIRGEVAAGVLTPGTAKNIMAYVRSEAITRYNNAGKGEYDKSIVVFENEIYAEIGTTREEVAKFMRPGPKPQTPSAKKPFDSAVPPGSTLPAVPARP
jgi:hypothetical protein